MNSQEHLVRAHAIAISINVLGIFLSYIKNINVIGSLVLYFLNTLGNLLYIKHKTLNNKNNNKELRLWKTEEL